MSIQCIINRIHAISSRTTARLRSFQKVAIDVNYSHDMSQFNQHIKGKAYAFKHSPNTID